MMHDVNYASTSILYIVVIVTLLVIWSFSLLVEGQALVQSLQKLFATYCVDAVLSDRILLTLECSGCRALTGIVRFIPQVICVSYKF